jgi:hypothetical protein
MDDKREQDLVLDESEPEARAHPSAAESRASRQIPADHPHHHRPIPAPDGQSPTRLVLPAQFKL